MSRSRLRIAWVVGLVAIVAVAGGLWLIIANDGSKASAASYTSAQQIADKLSAAGLNVSQLHQSDADLSGAEKTYSVMITAQRGKAGPDSGINMFATSDDLDSWVQLSKRFGGVAVVGGTWAVSLPSNPRSVGLSLAPKVADALDGNVEK